MVAHGCGKGMLEARIAGRRAGRQAGPNGIGLFLLGVRLSTGVGGLGRQEW